MWVLNFVVLSILVTFVHSYSWSAGEREPGDVLLYQSEDHNAYSFGPPPDGVI